MFEQARGAGKNCLPCWCQMTKPARGNECQATRHQGVEANKALKHKHNQSLRLKRRREQRSEPESVYSHSSYSKYKAETG